MPLAIEMKNHSSKISLDALLKEVSEVSKNRACEHILLVASSSCIPAESTPLNFYGPRDRFAVCEEGYLKMALRVMISRARLDYEASRPDSDIDIPNAIAATKAIQAALLKFKSFKSNCTAIKKSAIKIEDAAAELKEEI